MRNLTKHLALAAAMACALGAAPIASADGLQPTVSREAPVRLDDAVNRGDAGAQLQQAQFLFGGRNYCWYAGGWHGPGYYWCGYAWRRGFGWGGPVGWNGWRWHAWGGGWHGRGWRGGGWRHGGWHGGHGGWRHR